MRICERCGTPNDDSARFCDTGGTILPDPDPDAAPPPAGYGAPPPLAYGPPAAPPPAPPGQPPGGWQGPPAMRPPSPPSPKGRRTMLALVAGLVAFLVVGAARAGAYFALVKDDDGPGKTTSTEAGATPTSGTEDVPTDTTTDGTTDTSSSKPDKPATFRVNICGRLSPARRCGAPGFNRSGNVKRFYIWLAVLNAPKGKAVRILLTNAGTGKNLLSPTRYVTTGAKKNIFTLRVGGGPFGSLRAAIAIKYKRDIIKFKPPLRLNLR